MITAIVQARMKSTRLPGKILFDLPLGSSKTILDHIVDRLRKVPSIQKIIISTSTNPENDILSDFCKRKAITLFRGSEDSVLDRFYQTASLHGATVIIRLTGDNPIVDHRLLECAINEFNRTDIDYLKTEGLPIGMNFEIFTYAALTKAHKNASEPFDIEHVTPYIRNSTLFKIQNFVFETNTDLQNLRLTIDYPDDYIFTNLLFSYFSEDPHFGIEEIKKLRVDFPWVFSQATFGYQKKKYTNLNDEIQGAVEVLKKLELSNAAEVLFSTLNR